MWQVELRKQYASWLSRFHLLPSDGTPPGRHCTVLNYHYFSSGAPASYLEVSAHSLEAQLKILHDTFTVVPLREAAIDLTESHFTAATRPLVAISIDDGCSSFETVLHAFERLKIPVTLFVPPGLCMDDGNIDGLRSWCLRRYAELVSPAAFAPAVNGAEEFFRKVMAADTRELKAWTDVMSRLPAQPDPISGRRLMGIGRLRSLAAHPLVTVASHSMSHQSLATLPEPWCRWELETSVRYIREWGGDPEAFGYPYGDAMAFSGTTEKLLAANGVRCAFTTLAFRVSKDSRPLALGRATLYDSAGFHYMRGTAGGAFERWENARAKK